MRVFLSAIFMSLVLLCVPPPAVTQKPAPVEKTKVHQWGKDSGPGGQLKSPNATKMPLISAQGNQLVDPQGNTVLLYGVSISDPDKIENQGHWSKELFVNVQQTAARLIRIPVHLIAWRERTPEKYLALLDQAVEWCTELGMYIDIDW
jgi:endoglucanase